MTINPELKPFIEALDRAWPEPPLSLPLPQWRARVEQLAAQASLPRPPGMSVSDLEVQGKERTVPIRVYTPQAPAPHSCLIYMHGGGWVLGSRDSHDAITANLANVTPCVVVSVDYARAPEHVFPAAVDDCREAVKWVFAHCADLGIRPASIFVGGDSAGANLAAAMTLAFRADPQHRLCGQVLLYPTVDCDFSRPSYVSEANAPFVKTAEIKWFWDQYCPDLAARKDPLAAPMNARDLSRLPPALVAVAEHDPLYDEGRAYAARLVEAGVATEFRPGRGLIHGFLRARTISRAAAAEVTAICAWIRRTGEPLDL